MPGYLTKQDPIAVTGVALLNIRSLLDRQQFADPFGDAERLGISSAAWPLFGLLWPSGALLAAHLALRPVGDERILEIGCGLALASLVGHRRGGPLTARRRGGNRAGSDRLVRPASRRPPHRRRARSRCSATPRRGNLR